MSSFRIIAKLEKGALAIFRNPPRNADDEFICHVEATSKMPMTYILVISYPLRNAHDEITRHAGGFGFFFISTLRITFDFHPDFSAFCDFSNILALYIEVILAVTFWKSKKYCMRSRKIKHEF